MLREGTNTHPTIIFLGIGIPILIFVVFKSLFDFTFLADDYQFLAEALAPGGISLARFGHYWARIPVWSLLTWSLFSSHVFESGWWFMHIVFGLHVVSFSLLTIYLLGETGELRGNRILILLLATFALFPNFYEVLYWPTDMAYVAGSLFLAIALLSKTPFLRLLLISLSFLVSEMFLLSALCFLLFPVLIKKIKFDSLLRDMRSNHNDILRPLSLWLASVALFFVIRKILSYWFGSYHHGVSLNPLHLAGHVRDALGILLSLHFYTVFWPETLVYLGTLFFLIILSLRKKSFSMSEIAWMTLMIVGSTAIYWPLAYSASRALYGAGCFFCAVCVWGISRIASQDSSARRAAAVASIVLISCFLVHTFRVFSIKDHNFKLLSQNEKQLADEMQVCLEPCSIEIKDPTNGFKRDWVLHRDYWPGYANWLKAKHAPKKAISFKFLNTPKPD